MVWRYRDNLYDVIHWPQTPLFLSEDSVITCWRKVTGSLNRSAVEEISQQARAKGDFSALMTINYKRIYCIHHKRTPCCLQRQQELGPHSNSLNFKTFLILCFHRRNIIKQVFISFWTGPYKDVVWSLYLCCLFLASVVARAPHDHVSLCRPALPAERGLSPSTVPDPGLAHTHTHTLSHSHIHTTLYLLYLRGKNSSPARVFPVSLCWETRSSGQIWSMWWPEI